MKISELVQKTGVSKETIHFYLREKLLKKPRKTDKNVACYTNQHVEQIKIIKGLQDNHFLPLSVIKQILNKKVGTGKANWMALKLISQHMRPVDLILGESDLEGTDAFLEQTGLGQKWLDILVGWQIITPLKQQGKTFYSSLDVQLGKLVTAMDALGFGPKDGVDPEILKRFKDTIFESLHQEVEPWMKRSLEKSSIKSVMEKGIQLSELMGLFLFYMYHKVALKEIEETLKKGE